MGNLWSIERGNNVRTRYSFDELNRLQDMVHERLAAGGAVTELGRFHYTVRDDGKRSGLNEWLLNAPDPSSGQVRQSTRGVTYSYDNSGRLTGELGQDGLGVSYDNVWGYDNVGNRTSTLAKTATLAAPGTFSSTTTVSASFNANDWLFEQTSSTNLGPASVQKWDYYADGAEKTHGYGTNTPAQNDWGFDGHLLSTATQGATSGGTVYQTDASGHRVSVTRSHNTASQKTTSYLVDDNTSYAQTFGHDIAGRQVWRRMPDSKIERTAYNVRGQVESTTDFRLKVTSMTYDERGRMRTQLLDASLGQNEDALTYDYPDEFTQVATRGSGANALTMTRYTDPNRGWLSSIKTPTGTLSYGYDAGGNRTSVSEVDGAGNTLFSNGYSYDALGRLRQVFNATSTPQVLASFGYDANGNREAILRQNGVSSAYTYDVLNQLRNLRHTKGAVTLANYSYNVRHDGKRDAGQALPDKRITHDVAGADNLQSHQFLPPADRAPQ